MIDLNALPLNCCPSPKLESTDFAFLTRDGEYWALLRCAACGRHWCHSIDRAGAHWFSPLLGRVEPTPALKLGPALDLGHVRRSVRSLRATAAAQEWIASSPESSAPPERIERFAGPYRFLSNFWPATVFDDQGRAYRTVEHAYQASKSTSSAERDRIAAAKHPGKAKRLGQRLSPDPTWLDRRVDIMRALLLQKFAPGSDLAAQLTSTFPSDLIEGNDWGDRFWGVCAGQGDNHLGVLLMEIRQMLIDGEKDPGARPTANSPSKSGTIVTLDGPSSTGKTTLADELARRLSGKALHTGLHYRTITHAMLVAGIPRTDGAALVLLASSEITLRDDGTLLVSGQSVTPAILETRLIDDAVSNVANLTPVREALIALQRAFVHRWTAAGIPVVVEGRDAATRIAPEALVKVYLTASAEERAKRRHAQRGTSDQLPSTKDGLQSRDRRDSGHHRTTANTPGVVVIDVTELAPIDVLERVWKLVIDRQNSLS